MAQRNNNLFKNIILFIIMIATVFFLYIMLEKDKAKRVEKKLINFQTEYKQYIDEDSSMNIEAIDKLSESSLFSGSTLAKYYDNFKSKTFKKIEKDYVEQLYVFNFLKIEDTNSYLPENKKKYQEIVADSNELSANLETEHDVEVLNNFTKNNEQLIEIARSELGNDRVAIKRFNEALANKGTRNTILNKCFQTQENKNWLYNKTISKQFCDSLGLQTCQIIFDSGDNNAGSGNKFAGYTLNNPKSLSKNKPYIDYVSYRSDDYRTNSKDIFKKYENDNYVYPEVYESEVQGRKIYKYNVVIIPKDYKLSCKTPS